eukprot:4916986-Alexandrium_andersonii.AAC.1
MTFIWRPRPRWRSQACAPSCAGALTARVRPLPGGKRCGAVYLRSGALRICPRESQRSLFLQR